MAADDDFLVPGDVDLSTNCDIDQAVLHKSTVLRLFACMSIASYLYLFWMYFVVKTPVLKRHPTRLAIYGCIIEMGYFQQYLWLPTIGKNYLYSDDANVEPFYCNSSLAASRWAFITQFCMIGVQLCFLVISVDLRLAYTNPFSSYKHNKYYFASFVILGSLFTALCLLAMGPRVYGYDEHGVVWIQDSRAPLAMNWPKFMLYYLIVTCIYTYSLWANFQFYRSNEKGLAVTISNRLSIMNRSKRFVLGHIFVDSFILSLEFLSFLSDSEQQLLLALPSYLQALRGVLGMGVIIYSNGQDITWQSMNPFYFPSSTKDKNMVEKVALEGLLQQPHLNTALRAEILYFSTQGIMYAARSFEHGAGDLDFAAGASYGDEETGHGGGNGDGGGPGAGAGAGAGAAAGAGASGNGGSGKTRVRGGGPGAVGSSAADDTEMYGFESHPTLGIRPSVVDESMKPGGARGVKPTVAATAVNKTTRVTGGAAGGDGGSSAAGPDLSAFHKAQDERVAAERERAFLDQVEYLGLARGSVSFRDVDVRHNSSSSASSPYTFAMARPPHIPTLVASNTAQNAVRSSYSARIDTRNPMSAVLGGGGRSSVTGSGKVRESEFEMQGSTVNARESADSARSASSVSTVKWRDTMDVEFSMGRGGNTGGGKTGTPDSWYRVPSVPTKSGTRRRHDEDSDSEAPSDAGSDRSNSTTVNMVKRTLQSAFSNAQHMFNPAFKEFRFKDFSPGYFAKVRAMCSITAEEYARSFEATCKETFSEGRSGAFMFFSSDQRCIAKSTSKTELLSLQRLMPHYVEYLTANPNSLLTRYLGAHCITMYGVELYFIVMLNCFPPQRLSERYDLKGSWVNRHALTKTEVTSVNGAKRKEVVKSPMLYLDNDLQHKLSLQPGVANQIAEQIFKDVEFLTLHKKMDYSLLIGVKKERFEVVSSLATESAEDGRESNVTISTRNGRITDHVLGHSMSAYHSPGMSSTLYQAASAGAAPPTPGAKTPTSSLRVIRRAEDDQMEPEEDGGLHTRYVEGPAKYYIGIIDMLQEWTLQKQLERAIKVYLYRYDADGISAMNPIDYSRRFLRRCVLETFEGLDEPAMSCVSARTADDSVRGHSAAASHGSAMGAF